MTNLRCKPKFDQLLPLEPYLLNSLYQKTLKKIVPSFLFHKGNNIHRKYTFFSPYSRILEHSQNEFFLQRGNVQMGAGPSRKCYVAELGQAAKAHNET